jgi:hypothetical protein
MPDLTQTATVKTAVREPGYWVKNFSGVAFFEK